MDIANNIIKHNLKNVYFFCGTACGGKTTVSKAFAKKHGYYWLDEDTLNAKMADISAPEYQSAWCTRPSDWETYFGRPYKEYHQWLDDCGKEALQMALLELVKLSATQKVAVDLYNMPPQTALELTQRNRIVFLVTTPERVIRDYYDRPGHRAIYDTIMSLRDPAAALENCNKMLAYGNQLYLDELYHSGLYYIMRDENSTVANTLELVEKHFGMGKDNIVAIADR